MLHRLKTLFIKPLLSIMNKMARKDLRRSNDLHTSNNHNHIAVINKKSVTGSFLKQTNLIPYQELNY